VPGLGQRSVERILAARRQRRLRLDDLGRLAASVKKLRPFVTTADHRPTRVLDRHDLRALLAPPEQLSLLA
jgi:predicted DNA-binding helix-hairpin-helix protein